MTRFFLPAFLLLSLPISGAAEIYLGQGMLSGEVSESSVLLQTRLTESDSLNEDGDLPGTTGVVKFEWSASEDFTPSSMTPFARAQGEQDFIVRQELTGLRPETRYFYRVIFGVREDSTMVGPTGSFSTLPGETGAAEVSFIVASCMNYNKFMHGKKGNAKGPITATAEDKLLGFPAFEAMQKIEADFFVGTGDIVYYDNRIRIAETLPEMRASWHEQFRFPRMIDFFRDVPTFWSKDDHDFRCNDSDNSPDRLPSSKTGIDLFKEQLPIASQGDDEAPTFRTVRVSRDLQIWLTEGRDYRSPNKMEDGPGKTQWGNIQRLWLERTLKASDAKWKLIISPTPMVGPDDAKKRDNHTNLGGFRHEADEFFAWLTENQIENLFTICGDRHWQYHSIHPAGIEEFAAGALNDENSRFGVAPGDRKGTDPDALIEQLFISPEPSGGFLVVSAGRELLVRYLNDEGEELYSVRRE